MLSLCKSMFVRSVSIFIDKWTGVKTCPFTLNIYVDSPGGIVKHSIEKKIFEKQKRLIPYLE